MSIYKSEKKHEDGKNWMRCLLASNAASPRYVDPYRLSADSDEYEAGNALKAAWSRSPAGTTSRKRLVTMFTLTSCSSTRRRL